MLTSSSDSQVLLTRLASIASEPLHQLGEAGEDMEEDEGQGDDEPRYVWTGSRMRGQGFI